VPRWVRSSDFAVAGGPLIVELDLSLDISIGR
jgi:hypothetical protein